MLKVTYRIFCAFLILLFWISGAGASSFHQHEKMSPASAGVSPFHLHEKMGSTAKNKNHGLTCLLEHHQKGLPCPHLKNHKTHKGFAIATDCGGKPAGSFPTSVDYSKNLFFPFKIQSLALSQNPCEFFFLSQEYQFNLPLQIDHPPKFL